MKQPINPLESAEKPDHPLTINLHDGSTEGCSIVVVHHNRPEYLNICLQSIYVMANLNSFEVIVVDNNSDSQDSKDYLDAIEQEGVKVVRNKENLFWSAAANQGYKLSDKSTKYVLFLHCDTVILDPSFLDICCNLLESRNCGMVGMQLNSYYIQKQKADFIQEWFVMFTRECFEAAKMWPESLPLVGNAFIMTYKCQLLGFKPLAMTNNLAHHYRAASFSPNVYERFSEQAMSIVPKLMAEAQNNH